MDDKSLDLLKKRQQDLATEAEALVGKLRELKQTEQELGGRLNHISAAITEFDSIIKQLETK